jgi:hypothetical protein
LREKLLKRSFVGPSVSPKESGLTWAWIPQQISAESWPKRTNSFPQTCSVGMRGGLGKPAVVLNTIFGLYNLSPKGFLLGHKLPQPFKE